MTETSNVRGIVILNTYTDRIIIYLCLLTFEVKSNVRWQVLSLTRLSNHEMVIIIIIIIIIIINSRSERSLDF